MKQFLIGIDQLINTVFGGWADETLSARCHRCSYYSYKWAIAKMLINMVFFWQDDHCAESYTSEVERFQLPPEYRNK